MLHCLRVGALALVMSIVGSADNVAATPLPTCSSATKSHTGYPQSTPGPHSVSNYNGTAADCCALWCARGPVLVPCTHSLCVPGSRATTRLPPSRWR